MTFDLNQIAFPHNVQLRIDTLISYLRPSPLMPVFSGDEFRWELRSLENDLLTSFSPSRIPVNQLIFSEAIIKSLIQRLLWQIWTEQVLPLDDAMYASNILLGQGRNLFHVENKNPTLLGTLLWTTPDKRATLFNPLWNVVPPEISNQILKQAAVALQRYPLDDDNAVTLKRSLLIHQTKVEILKRLEVSLTSFSVQPNERYLISRWKELLQRYQVHQRVDLRDALQQFTSHTLVLSETETQALTQWLIHFHQQLLGILNQFPDCFTSHTIISFSQQCSSMPEFLINSLCFGEDGHAYFLSSRRFFRTGMAGRLVSPYTYQEMFTPLVPSNSLLCLYYFSQNIFALINTIRSSHQLCLEQISRFLSLDAGHVNLSPFPIPAPTVVESPTNAQERHPSSNPTSANSNSSFSFFNSLLLDSPPKDVPKFPPGLGFK